MKKKDTIKKGSYVNETYMKCPYLNKECKWRMSEKTGSFSFLKNACYLSGAFKLDCPE